MKVYVNKSTLEVITEEEYMAMVTRIAKDTWENEELQAVCVESGETLEHFFEVCFRSSQLIGEQFWASRYVE